MAPIKFEEHVKEQLDKRKIRPSAGSWDKLNTRLDNLENKPKRRWWLSAVAAVAVLIIASLFFIDLQNESANPIVENPTEVKETQSQNAENPEQPVLIASDEKSDVRDQKAGEVKKPVVKEAEVTGDKPEESVNRKLAQNSSRKRLYIEPISIEPPQPDEDGGKFTEQIDELLAKIAQKEKQNGHISEAEVNALLAEAAREINSSGNNSKEKLSADALLADVEYEMDQSFRQEVFEVLKEGFMKARTAIATRND